MIIKKPFFRELFWLLAVIALLHYFALSYFLYWTVDWFDILMHFLGGFWVAIVAAYLIYFFSSTKDDNYGVKYIKEHKILFFLSLVGATLIVGLTWELWEVFVGFTDTLNDLGDTILDVVMDTIGAICAFYYTQLSLKNNKTYE
jgi:hypothetical protein